MTKIYNRPLFAVLLVFVASTGVTLADDDKWVWGRSNEQSKADSRIGSSSDEVIRIAKPLLRNQPNQKPSPLFQPANNPRLDTKYYKDDSIRNGRYEVNEDYVPDRDPLIQQPIHISETFSSRPFDRPLPSNTLPQRPLSNFQAPLRPQRPPVIIDSVHAPSRKPVPVATEPAGSAVGILTGPVPSWQRPTVHKNGDPTNFEKCKCSFSFNCKSPGIKFGSCDEGKQYCCYNDFDGTNSGSQEVDKYGGDRSEPIPSVLVGPGGSHRPGLKPGIYGQVSNKNEYIDRKELVGNSYPNEPLFNRRPNEYGNNPFIIPRQL
ncbi:uncharacterized protein LOC112602155 isoform X1 [Melanaphis sacchari]|uniref:uncharacterized protein LOC112602155 isoform X1 n=1 Tax=Melanaphis sacchari TaxID=742174 RepID=UPI000DC14950|nr:uncharacterized protein LOC112602155 isoform X1 [Melanaphis sacchari]